jgi:hypothetical protein
MLADNKCIANSSIAVTKGKACLAQFKRQRNEIRGGPGLIFSGLSRDGYFLGLSRDGYFWVWAGSNFLKMLVYLMGIWYILRPFGIICGQFGILYGFWYIFKSRKSGNPCARCGVPLFARWRNHNFGKFYGFWYIFCIKKIWQPGVPLFFAVVKSKF